MAGKQKEVLYTYICVHMYIQYYELTYNVIRLIGDRKHPDCDKAQHTRDTKPSRTTTIPPFRWSGSSRPPDDEVNNVYIPKGFLPSPSFYSVYGPFFR